MDKYLPTIGLEIHAELKTGTKMFCDSKNDPDEKVPNVNICPICMGYPGTLPVINKEAVRHVLRMGEALGGEIADFTEFDRKNYFYPDIPKGYQISQYKYPLVRGGKLNNVSITRVHLEEDTARSQHMSQINADINPRISADNPRDSASLLDFNRAGVPLMELVTEPVIHSAEEASAFAKELQLLLQYLGAGDANMEKGEMRVEANVSVSERPRTNADLTQTDAERSSSLGVKVEIKNLNSFRAVEKAIAYETRRHIELLEKGEKVIQETRGWDEVKEITFSQRTKEESHDYRYFPDPDLPKLSIQKIDSLHSEAIKTSLPELPWNKRTKYIKVMGIKAEDAEFFVINRNWGMYFDSIAGDLNKSEFQLAANYITSDLAGLVRSDSSVKDETEVNLLDKVAIPDFAELIKMIIGKKISSRGAKDILKKLYEGEEGARRIAEVNDLIQKSDDAALITIVNKIIADNQKVVADYKEGKEAALQYLIGQGMKASKGSANPELLKKIFTEKLPRSPS